VFAKLVLAAAGAALAAAHPEYVARCPNGANAGEIAIGHVNPAGGGAENSFGNDFHHWGDKAWTRALCLKDSDGDGQSNGLELGDPCCVWVAGGPAPNATVAISQPGVKSSTTNRTCKDIACTNGVNPCKPTAPAPSLLRGSA
jgi:hypothetical protein